jgi:hypothetical protein
MTANPLSNGDVDRSATDSSGWPFQLRGVGVADWGIAILLLLAGWGYVRLCLHHDSVPFEDAAMLMRYAQHLAHGSGIVWNIGERPIDGATDFLFMVVVAAAVRLGASIQNAVYAINVAAHLLSVALIFLTLRGLGGAKRALALFAAVALLVGPGSFYIDAYFGTPFFALAVTVAWAFAIAMACRPSGPLCAAFALSALIMGLVRPDGVFLACFMLAAALWQLAAGGRGAWIKPLWIKPIAWFVGVFGLLGGAYFLWRWHYFGQPLPNPFYKKGGGRLHIDGLKNSIRYVVKLIGPFWIFPCVGIVLSGRWRAVVFAMIPVAAFTGIWVLLSMEMDYQGRFQYAVLPIALMAFVPLANGAARGLRLPQWSELSPCTRRVGPVVIAAMALLFVWSKMRELQDQPMVSRNGILRIAQGLNAYAGQGYGMAVSEAGLLPFYSQWRALDVWGLNDRVIAHSGRLDAQYLDDFHPDVIMFHVSFSPLIPPSPDPRLRALDQACLTLEDYAQGHDYELAAIWGPTPSDVQYFYVRRNLPDSAAIVNLIRRGPYTIVAGGEPCRDWRPKVLRQILSEHER